MPSQIITSSSLCRAVGHLRQLESLRKHDSNDNIWGDDCVHLKLVSDDKVNTKAEKHMGSGCETQALLKLFNDTDPFQERIRQSLKLKH